MVQANITIASGTFQRGAPVKVNTRIERTGNGRTTTLDCILYYWNRNDAGMGVKLMEPWTNCNSLRYGFDENYDSPVFDDEDISEEEETNQ